MTDIGTTGTTGASTGFDFSPAKIGDFIRKSDLGLAIGIMAILVVLILPLPTWLLDVSLAFSLSFSILILMTAVFIRKPLEFSSFPDHPADHHHAAAGAESGLHPPDPGPWQ